VPIPGATEPADRARGDRTEYDAANTADGDVRGELHALAAGIWRDDLDTPPQRSGTIRCDVVWRQLVAVDLGTRDERLRIFESDPGILQFDR